MFLKAYDPDFLLDVSHGGYYKNSEATQKPWVPPKTETS